MSNKAFAVYKERILNRYDEEDILEKYEELYERPEGMSDKKFIATSIEKDFDDGYDALVFDDIFSGPEEFDDLSNEYIPAPSMRRM